PLPLRGPGVRLLPPNPGPGWTSHRTRPVQHFGQRHRCGLSGQVSQGPAGGELHCHHAQILPSRSGLTRPGRIYPRPGFQQISHENPQTGRGSQGCGPGRDSTVATAARRSGNEMKGVKEPMNNFDYQIVEEAAKQLYIRALCDLPPDVRAALQKAYARETQPTARAVFEAIFKNIEIADRNRSLI